MMKNFSMSLLTFPLVLLVKTESEESHDVKYNRQNNGVVYCYSGAPVPEARQRSTMGKKIW